MQADLADDQRDSSAAQPRHRSVVSRRVLVGGGRRCPARAAAPARACSRQRLRPTSGARAITLVRVCAGVDRVGWLPRASSCVLASTSPNLPNSVFTAPSTSQTSARALLQRQRAKAHLQAVQRGQQRGRAGERDAVARAAAPPSGPAGAAPRRTGLRSARTGCAKSVVCGGATYFSRIVLRLQRAGAVSMRLAGDLGGRPRRRAPARRAGARSPRAGTWRRSAATAARRRRAGPAA